ncbi:MAG: 3-phosphoshikimate 1-carboxyvinyltransferase [Firmicutes bacterium HGW-Firmicutes-16]|nr:MAG: 3-phosphoshikimate 1-carboxyvinyltransferase [Firmicutes bacterium HGW-Firmicutes-16]
MDVIVTPSKLSGSVSSIPSKSVAHRLLICAALADKPTSLVLPSSSDDIDATIGALKALGAVIEREDDTVTITPIGEVPENPVLDCRESGSTLRFMLPVAAALCEHVSFTGGGRLPERPITELSDAMKRHGVSFSSDKLPYEMNGRLTGGEFIISGGVSSQYLTGLLLALPSLEEDSSIKLSSKLVSSAYVDITLLALERFGVKVKRSENEYQISGSNKFRSPERLSVDGDWSNAAFFLAAGAIGVPVTVTGLDSSSPQGDKAIVALLQRFGAEVSSEGTQFTVKPGRLRGCEIDLSEVPDLLPALSVVAAYAEGETNFVNGAHLRYKESDRLASTASMINAMGGKAQAYSDALTVFGGALSGGTVSSFNDHRIAMAAAIAGSACSGPVTITGAEAVNKSHPAFFSDYVKLGGKADVI